MKTKFQIWAAAVVPAAMLAFGVAGGCQKAGEPIDITPTADNDHEQGEPGHVHGEWWCDEHGVPEKVCALCNSKLAAEYQRKGDWCAKHERPDSQCFLCHPELEDRFAAQYEAKYGKKPPKPRG